MTVVSDLKRVNQLESTSLSDKVQNEHFIKALAGGEELNIYGMIIGV